MHEPGVEIVGAAELCAPPNLGYIVVVIIVLFVLHGVTPRNFRRKRNLRNWLAANTC
jgi:hypothetical protein